MRRAIPMFLVLLVVAVMPLTALANGQFTDDDGSVHEGDIERLAALDITRGCNPPANDNFCPDDPVTRGQMAAFLVRALGLPAGDETFEDTAGHLFAEEIASLADADVTRGCNPPTNDNFCPDDPVTRGQMAAFLTRALDLVAGDKTFEDAEGHIFEADIAALAEGGITRGCNPPANDSYCPDDPVTRAQMASFLVRAIDHLTPTWTVLPDDGTVSGKGYGEMIASWWAHLLERSTDEEWWSDPSTCGFAFSEGGVYYAPSGLDEGHTAVACTMPAGEAIYLSPAGLVCVEGLDDPPAIEDCLDFWWNEVGVVTASVTIDGVPLEKLSDHESPGFSVTMPENNWYEAPAGTHNAQARNYVAVVEGLDPGQYEIFLDSEWGDGFAASITITLTAE